MKTEHWSSVIEFMFFSLDWDSYQSYDIIHYKVREEPNISFMACGLGTKDSENLILKMHV